MTPPPVMWVSGAAGVQRAAAGLGLPATALRLFELREVPQDGELPAGVQRVAFAVANTSKSLSPNWHSPCPPVSTQNAQLHCDYNCESPVS